MVPAGIARMSDDSCLWTSTNLNLEMSVSDQLGSDFWVRIVNYREI